MRTVEEIKADIAKPCDYTDTCELTAELVLALTAGLHGNLDRLEEICNAEREGGCVVLPCRVGDTVYFTDEAHPTATIEEIKLSKGENQYCWVQYDTGPESCELWDEGYFEDDEISETVFLTPEAALKERDNNA